MSITDVKNVFKEKGALLEGHFLLSSGLHSSMYLQCALVLSDTKLAKDLGEMLAEKMKSIVKDDVDLVVAPAMGGLIIGHEVASAMNKNFVFTERVDGNMVLRRGFNILEGAKVVIIEDVFTTGKSTREVISLLNDKKAKILGCASIIDRSNGTLKFDVPNVSLLNLEVPIYEKEKCPMCAKNMEVEKPGSRFLKK